MDIKREVKEEPLCEKDLAEAVTFEAAKCIDLASQHETYLATDCKEVCSDMKVEMKEKVTGHESTSNKAESYSHISHSHLEEHKCTSAITYLDTKADTKIEIKEEPLCEDGIEMDAQTNSSLLSNPVLQEPISCLPEELLSAGLSRLCTESENGDSRVPTSSTGTYSYCSSDFQTAGIDKLSGEKFCDLSQRKAICCSCESANQCKCKTSPESRVSQKDKYNEKYSLSLLAEKQFYRCEVCMKTFRCFLTLKQHQLTHKNFSQVSEMKSDSLSHKDSKQHSGSKAYQCDECHKSFSWISHLRLHMLIHEGTKPHCCQLCGKSFIQLSNLKRHMYVHEGKRQYKCEICAKSFSQMAYLKMHATTHKGRKLFRCDICDKQFTWLSALKRHLLIHADRNHNCDVCGKSFARLEGLANHMSVHDGRGLRKCRICREEFTHLSDLKNHVLTHGEKNYKCDICDRIFIQTCHLKEHLLIHEDKKQFQCEVCNKCFRRASNLKTHMLIHEGKRPHSCTKCNKAFTDRSTLNRHILIHGDKKNKCELCDKRFVERAKLKKHVLSHREKVQCK